MTADLRTDIKHGIRESRSRNEPHPSALARAVVRVCADRGVADRLPAEGRLADFLYDMQRARWVSAGELTAAIVDRFNLDREV